LERWGSELAIGSDTLVAQLGPELTSTKGHGNERDIHAKYKNMWEQRVQAWELANEVAKQRGSKYKYIAMIRTDHVFMDVLNLSELSNRIDGLSTSDRSRSIIVPACCDFDGYCDRLAAGAWDAMSVYFEPEQWIDEYHRKKPALQAANPNVSFKTQTEGNLKGHFYLRNLTRIDVGVQMVLLRRAAIEKYCNNETSFETGWPQAACFNKQQPRPPRPPCPSDYKARIAKSNTGHCSFRRRHRRLRS